MNVETKITMNIIEFRVIIEESTPFKILTYWGFNCSIKILYKEVKIRSMRSPQ